jgi:hypothetical protein
MLLAASSLRKLKWALPRRTRAPLMYSIKRPRCLSFPIAFADSMPLLPEVEVV